MPAATRKQQQQEKEQRSRFASRGAFDLLRADESEEEEEEEEEDEDELQSSPPPVAATTAHKAATPAPVSTPQSNGNAPQAVKEPAPVAAPAPAKAPAPAPVAAAAAVPSPAPVAKPAQPTVVVPPVAKAAPAAQTAPQSQQKKPAVAAASTTAPAPTPAPASTPQDALAAVEQKRLEERIAYWKKIRERTVFTFVMIFGFVGLLLLGHPYMIILVLIIQVLVYREVTALFEIPGRPSITGGGPRRSPLSRHNSSNKVPTAGDNDDDDDDFRAEERKELIWSKTLSWYFFTVANFFLYGESLIYYFKHIVFVDSYFIPFARHHRFLSFLLYIIGFVGFVSGLRRENLKHQFGLFGWVHMSLLLIVFSSHFLVNNILEGLVWFFVPASLVICNDVFAYVCGMIWGKTPLISLSPKKTVEGFVGAFIITEVFAYGWATCFQRYNYMICPATSLGMNAFQDIQCRPNAVFEWNYFVLPQAIASALNFNTAIPYTGFQLHSLVMAAFASLVAPFGGFFASGFKRAFNIKDFGDSIPGHGGLTDRFDCQFLMGLFSYVYYSSLIRDHHVTVGSVLQTVVTHLSAEEQLEAYRELGRFLVARGHKL